MSASLERTAVGCNSLAKSVVATKTVGVGDGRAIARLVVLVLVVQLVVVCDVVALLVLVEKDTIPAEISGKMVDGRTLLAVVALVAAVLLLPLFFFSPVILRPNTVSAFWTYASTSWSSEDSCWAVNSVVVANAVEGFSARVLVAATVPVVTVVVTAGVEVKSQGGCNSWPAEAG